MEQRGHAEFDSFDHKVRQGKMIKPFVDLQELRRRIYRAARAMGVEAQVLEGADRGWKVSQSRPLVRYVLIRRLGYKLKDVTKYLGRDVATVSSLVSRLDVRMNESETLRRRVVRMTAECLE